MKAKPDEDVIFSWLEYPDKATRDSANNAMMNDPVMKLAGKSMPFDGQRMIWGGVGNTPEEFRKNSDRFEELLSFASAADRAAMRGGNARRLFFS